MKTLLKKHFPNHRLEDKHDFGLQQFSANDMMEFAIEVAKEALRNAADNFTIDDLEVSEGGQLYYDIITHNIQDESNIPNL